MNSRNIKRAEIINTYNMNHNNRWLVNNLDYGKFGT